MATLFDDASLVMIPSGYKDDKLYSIKPTSGDGDFTFSRDGSGASPATRVNSAGLIEKGRTNFLLNSIWDGVGTNTAPTSWTNGFTSGNYESAASSTNGNTSIRFYGTSARRYISQAPSFGGIMALSIYVESVTTADEIRYILNQIGGTELFYLENSSVVANTTSISSGKTYTLVFNTSGTTEIRIGGGVTGSRTYDFTLSVPQLEKGLVRTSYIETTTAAASAGILGDMPRLDYSGGATCPSLLLEPARTNLLPQSEYFDGYTKYSVTVTNNFSTSPEGVQNASKLTDTDSYDTIRKDISVVNGSTYTISVFAKNPSSGEFALRAYSGSGNDTRRLFNLNDLTITSAGGDNSGLVSGSDKIEDYGNGWYRCSFSYIPTSTNLELNIYPDNPTNTGSNSVEVYGFQCEASSYPTSYVPTYGSATARAVDVCNKSSATSVIGQTEGTMFIEAKIDADKTDDYNRIFGISQGNDSYRIIIFSDNQEKISLNVKNAGVSQAQIVSTISPFSTFKAAVGYAANDFVFYINGQQIGTDSSGTVPACNTISLGTHEDGSGTRGIEGSVKQALLFDTRLTNAELAALTTI